MIINEISERKISVTCDDGTEMALRTTPQLGHIAFPSELSHHAKRRIASAVISHWRKASQKTLKRITPSTSRTLRKRYSQKHRHQQNIANAFLDTYSRYWLGP
tara:strand:- start:365 stop:673 length:309 start_codon:yes stop_codon:yes gene_type:complete